MNIQIHSQDLTITPKIKNYLKHRLDFLLKKRSHDIQAVHVTLADINGPKGGYDKRCKIKIIMNKVPPVFINDTRESLKSAIDIACQRARQSLCRKLDKGRSKRRQYIPAHDLIASAQ